MDKLPQSTPFHDNHVLVAEIKRSSDDEGPSCSPTSISLGVILPKAYNLKLKGTNRSVSEVPEDQIQGNPIGMLQELCMMRRWLPPDYTTEEETGLPHERHFTIRCTVNDLTEYGVGRSKKLAKRQSAHKMAQRILMMPLEDENITQNPDDEDEIGDRFVNQKGSKNLGSGNGGVSRRISLFHKNFKSLNGPRLKILKETNDDELNNIDAVRWLNEVALQNNLEITYVKIDEKSKSDKCQYLVQISTVPVIVCHGTADTYEDAQIEATINSIKYIRDLSK